MYSFTRAITIDHTKVAGSDQTASGPHQRAPEPIQCFLLP